MTCGTLKESRTIVTPGRGTTSVVLGVIGALALVAFSKQVSTLTFGSAQHTAAVCLISLAVLFQLVSAGQGALIQGMRRIADLAKMNVIGALIMRELHTRYGRENIGYLWMVLEPMTLAVAVSSLRACRCFRPFRSRFCA